MKTKLFLAVGILLAITLIAPIFVSAQELTPLDGVKTEEIKSIPSSFGLWWRGIKEWTSTTLTFDPVKKAEKQLQFAQERTNLANYIVENSTDSRVQGKAMEMLTKAEEFIQKISEKKDKLTEKAGEKTSKLLENIAKQQLNKERVLEKIEDKLPPEALQSFQEFRTKLEEKSTNLLNTLQSSQNVPQEVKDKVIEVISQVQSTKTNREEIRVQQKDILEAIENGVEGAKAEFETMRVQLKQQMSNSSEVGN